jgi:hypothetical protein
MILASCFAIPHESTQWVSRQDDPLFKSRPPLTLASKKKFNSRRVAPDFNSAKAHRRFWCRVFS